MRMTEIMILFVVHIYTYHTMNVLDEATLFEESIFKRHQYQNLKLDFVVQILLPYAGIRILQEQ